MLDVTRILTQQEIGKMIIEDAIRYAFEKKLHIRVYVYGNYYSDFCLKYLLEADRETIRRIDMAEKLK